MAAFQAHMLSSGSNLSSGRRNDGGGACGGGGGPVSADGRWLPDAAAEEVPLITVLKQGTLTKLSKGGFTANCAPSASHPPRRTPPTPSYSHSPPNAQGTGAHSL